MTEIYPAPLERVSTGDDGLDQVLHGGLFRGSVSIIQGTPGAGKTILANQVAFHFGRRGGQSLYVTLLAESHGRLTSNMRNMEFFEPQAVGRSLHYISGYSALCEAGAKGILQLVAAEAKAHGAALVVLDGLFVLEEAFETEREFREFVHDLAMQAELMNCTVLLLTNSKRMSSSPEYTMVDVWIELGRETHEYRTIRSLEVHKMRGSDFLSGRHAVVISDDGLQVLPRLEAVLGRSPQGDSAATAITSGIPALDEMLSGGLVQGSSTLLLGPPGIGKTTVGLHFLAQSSREQPGLLFGFYETPPRVLRKAAERGIELGPRVASGAVDIVWNPPTENRLERRGYDLDNVRRRDVRRLVVDGVNAFLQSSVYPERIGRFLTALTNELRVIGCTTVFTEVGEPGVPEMCAEKTSALRRVLSIMKMRDSDFDAHAREFAITSQGIEIGLPSPAVERSDADAHSHRAI